MCALQIQARPLRENFYTVVSRYSSGPEDNKRKTYRVDGRVLRRDAGLFITCEILLVLRRTPVFTLLSLTDKTD